MLNNVQLLAAERGDLLGNSRVCPKLLRCVVAPVHGAGHGVLQQAVKRSLTQYSGFKNGGMHTSNGTNQLTCETDAAQRKKSRDELNLAWPEAPIAAAQHKLRKSTWQRGSHVQVESS